MKKIYFLLFLSCLSINTFAQTLVNDSVTMITGYQQDVFYNLNTGAKAVALIKNWDLAFSTNALEVGIRINSVNGVNLWAVPGIDINGWATLDSAGYQSWAELHNTDSAIYYGAFNINANGSTFDFSWGVYDFNTHEVVGDSLFLIKVTDLQGNVYFKKLWIVKRANNSTHDWIFRYANLDNSNDITVTIPTTIYTDKNFIYYSIINDSILDREPNKSDWDIQFTRYTSDVGGGNYYPVAGVYSNFGVEIADVKGVDVAGTNSDTPYLNLYSSHMDEIGYDWKTFNQANNMWEVEDSLVYFVKTNAGEVYKLVMTGFEGSLTGNIFFNKTFLYLTGINEVSQSNLELAVYPNPAQDITYIVFNAIEKSKSTFIITDIQGKIVLKSAINTQIGLNKIQVNISDLSKGVYFLNISTPNQSSRQKLIIQ